MQIHKNKIKKKIRKRVESLPSTQEREVCHNWTLLSIKFFLARTFPISLLKISIEEFWKLKN